MAVTLALLEGTLVVAIAGKLSSAFPALVEPGTAGFLAALLLGLAWVVGLYYADLYDLRTIRTLEGFVRRLPVAVGLGASLLIAVFALAPSAGLDGRGLSVAAAVSLGPLLVVRAIAYRAVGGRSFAERVLVVGDGPLARRLAEEIAQQPRLRHVVLGVVGSEAASGELPARCLRLGSAAGLRRTIRDFDPDRIVVALGERRGGLDVQDLLEARSRGVIVEDGVEVYERLAGKLAIEALTPSSLIYSPAFRPGPVTLAAKRALSLVASVFGLLLLAPVLALIAVLIKLDSRGPILFIQDRVGLGGRPFRLFKFRTMRPAAGATSEWVRDNAQRITRVGWWLRRFRLDELPQLLNVIRGDMDLVGPRPHPLTNYPVLVLVTRNAPECGERIPYYALRLLVRPGITGWAQVLYGYANGLDEETEKLRYDLYYVKRVSFWLDLRIVLETVKTVLFGRGASASRGPSDDREAENPAVVPSRPRRAATPLS